MKVLFSGLAAFLFFCGTTLAQTDILFVGNSFTHGQSEPALSYNKANVTDENGNGYGGVPGIFKKLTTQAGLAYNVSLELASGQTLAWHLGNKAAVIGRENWKIVVLQELSTAPLPVKRGGKPDSFYQAARDLQNLVHAHAPAARLVLFQTWASPTTAEKSGYRELSEMQDDLHAAYAKAQSDLHFDGVAPVGDAFLRVPPACKVWGDDNRHASRYGSYLAAAVLFARITGLDPRSLSTEAGTAASDLAISEADAKELNRIAYEAVAQPLVRQLAPP